MKTLQRDDNGRDVEVWQRFLAQAWIAEFDTMRPGHFDEATEEATRAFQEVWKIDVTGVVDRDTQVAANLLGLSLIDGGTAKFPTFSKVLTIFIVFVAMSFMSQCMLSPDSGVTYLGTPLPVNPNLLPGTPKPQPCPSLFC